MATEANYEFLLGDFWAVPFSSARVLTSAYIAFTLNGHDVSALILSNASSPAWNPPATHLPLIDLTTSTSPSYNSPTFGSPDVPTAPQLIDPIIIDASPFVSGAIVVSPDDQTQVTPGLWNYEIKAEFDDGFVSILAYGKIVVQASLFA